MESVKVEVPTGVVQGEYDERFESVVDRFVENYHDHDEVGASLCVSFEGETVIDVWGGAVDRELSAPWESRHHLDRHELHQGRGRAVRARARIAGLARHRSAGDASTGRSSRATARRTRPCG